MSAVATKAKSKDSKASSKAGKKGKRGRAGAVKITAANADRYELYQQAVQSPDEDAAFLARVFRSERGRPARHFREDFCGTGLLSATWVRRSPDNTAEGYDIDPEPLAWGHKHNIEPLGTSAKRVRLFEADARSPSERTPDVRCAQNFSYWIFMTRAEMLAYFRNVYEDLGPDGIFVIDVHGGPECFEELEEETEVNKHFTYVWEQKSYSPVTGEATLNIHFKFRDGTRMKSAFRYHWRVWSIPELRDILHDAGFPQVDCYWEGTDEDGESGNGIFRKTRKGTNDPAWVAYLVAPK